MNISRTAQHAISITTMQMGTRSLRIKWHLSLNGQKASRYNMGSWSDFRAHRLNCTCYKQGGHL